MLFGTHTVIYLLFGVLSRQMNSELKAKLENVTQNMVDGDQVFLYINKNDDQPFDITTNMSAKEIAILTQSLLMTIKFQSKGEEYFALLKEMLSSADKVHFDVQVEGNDTMN